MNISAAIVLHSIQISLKITFTSRAYVVNNEGKGSFYATDLDAILAVNNITTLLVCGVTTEVCVHTTVREANDRGKHCIVVSDCCASFFEEFHRVALEMIVAQGGIFGSVTDSASIITALAG